MAPNRYSPAGAGRPNVATQGPARACLGCLTVLLLMAGVALSLGWRYLPESVWDAAGEYTRELLGDEPEGWLELSMDSAVTTQLMTQWQRQSVSVDAWLVRRELDAYLEADPGARGDAPAAMVRAAIVEPSWLEILGIEPMLGRGFTDSDVGQPVSVAILSAQLWNDRYGGSAEIIGRLVDLADSNAVVVGVLPEGAGPQGVQMWFAGSPRSADGAGGSLVLLLRLRDGVESEAAEAELTQIARNAGVTDAEVRLQPPSP